ncbi:MAG: hypothetical protein EOP33_09565 [Rickettsiaceae bacterium]|nr:MAG: hypothetical protein EOP33_09565 [Rickettsiaceae bacterium]
MENKYKLFLHFNFTMSAITDQNNEIEATHLLVTDITPHQSLIKMQSLGYVKHTEIRGKYGRKTDEEKINYKLPLFYLEFEGLKMVYSDLTETIKARGGVKINDFDDLKRDHTSATLIYDSEPV